jgi:hypothetical protein
MRDTDLYQRILGLEKPWFVKWVDLQVAESRVDIWLEHPGGAKWPCPKCGQELPCRDHAEERACAPCGSIPSKVGPGASSRNGLPGPHIPA